jgi:hypothetical protein
VYTRKQRDLTPEEAKNHLKNYGWTYRSVCRPNGPLDISFNHLSRVLNHHRQSASLLKKIFSLPTRDQWNAKTRKESFAA